MKILQIVNPTHPFPPQTVGGVERVVLYLIEELKNLGHEITLMAHEDSIVPEGIKFIPIGTNSNPRNTIYKIYKHLLFNSYDVVHNHGRLIYFLPLIWGKTRKIHSFHMAELENKQFLRFQNLKPNNLTYCPCGKWIKDKSSHLKGDWSFVNNGLPIGLYQHKTHSVSSDAPLVVISRMTPSKGVKTAIEVAKACNRKLIIAGKVGDFPHEIEWFENHIKNECDGEQIRFIGPVNDIQKNNLLNEAAALLIATSESEAFNTTMLEANACGCPVISYDKYCFTEYVINGTNGYKVNDFAGLVEAVTRLNKIDRNDCRRHFEISYTSKIMTDNYLKIYKS